MKSRRPAGTGNAAVARQGAAFCPHKQLEASELLVHPPAEIISVYVYVVLFIAINAKVAGAGPEGAEQARCGHAKPWD